MEFITKINVVIKQKKRKIKKNEKINNKKLNRQNNFCSGIKIKKLSNNKKRKINNRKISKIIFFFFPCCGEKEGRKEEFVPSNKKEKRKVGAKGYDLLKITRTRFSRR